MQNFTPTPDETARLRALQQAFLAKMQALPEKHQRAYVHVTSAKAAGLGDDQADPYVQALATSTHEGFQIKDRMAAAQAEIDEISKLDPRVYKPRDPNWYARAATRQAELEQQKASDLARFLNLAEDGHERAQRKAVELYREEAERSRKAAAYQEARARAEAAADTAALDRRAAEDVAANRKANQSHNGGI